MWFCNLVLCQTLLGVAFQTPGTALQQIPNLKSLPDSTDELQRRIDSGGGNLLLGERKVLRVTRPLVFDLSLHGAISIKSDRGATIVMDGPGPALKILGTHEGTASPKSFKPSTWNQRMPLISGIEILGNHELADGVQLVKTVGVTISNLSVRWCRHGIHLFERNRNVVISACHFYENSGVGIYLDDVNLHQINISSSHISYNRQGGVVVRDGNVRNIQVSGCDIEGNMPADHSSTSTANFLIDLSGSKSDRSASVAEVSITGCTIQHSANYGANGKTVAPGGANIRLQGKEVYPIDSVTIAGNVLSDTSTSVDLEYANDVAISANNFFAPKPTNLRVRHSNRVVVSGNTFNPRQFVRPGTIRFEDCSDCILANSTIFQFASQDGAVVLERCRGCLLNGLLLRDCGSGIVLRNSIDTTISSCRVSGTKGSGTDISIDSSTQDTLLSGNRFSGRKEISSEALVP